MPNTLSAIEDVEEFIKQEAARKERAVTQSKKYESALDKIHLLLTSLEGRDYTPEERQIFDIAEDALLGIE